MSVPILCRHRRKAIPGSGIRSTATNTVATYWKTTVTFDASQSTLDKQFHGRRMLPVSVPRRLTAAVIQVLLIVILLSVSGCGADADGLAGRVAIDVSVQIDGTVVQDGTLVLRPEPGVKCPLITVPVVGGRAHLNQAQGPVPGRYSASFRPAGADLTEQLTEAGRLNPASGRNNQSPARNSSAAMAKPPRPLTIVVPDTNPAKLTANFVAE